MNFPTRLSSSGSPHQAILVKDFLFGTRLIKDSPGPFGWHGVAFALFPHSVSHSRPTEPSSCLNNRAAGEERGRGGGARGRE